MSTTPITKILCKCTVERHLPGLIGTASNSDMQKIRVIVFYSELQLVRSG